MIAHNLPGFPPAILVRQYVGRLLDISSVGCLIEIGASLAAGTVGRLEAVIDGNVHVEAVRVARVAVDPRGAGRHQLGLEFLIVAPPSAHSVRAAISRIVAGADAAITFVH